MKEKKKTKIVEKGITLIALVITIIVLIILAVVSINIIFGNEGIIEKAINGQDDYEEGVAVEKVKLILTDYVVEREVNEKKLIEYLNEKKENGELENVTNNNDGTITVEVDGYLITIVEENLEIKEDVIKNSKYVKIALNAKSARKNEIIKATLNFGEDIDVTKCKWVYTTDETIGTEDETKYLNEISGNEIELSSSEEGTYYLHILVVDKEGNKTEKVEGPIEVGNYVTEITLNKTELTLEEGKTETLTATVGPDDSTDKTITWTSSDESVATVNASGLITAKKAGEVTITATNEKSGVKAECKVTVTGKQPVQVTADTLKGAYIEYNVEYTDLIWGSEFQFTKENGWRIIDYTVDESDTTNTTIKNVKIMSTGIPAALYYHYNNSSNNTWWDDTTQMDFYNNVLGGSSYGSQASTYKGLQAAAGLYNNFYNMKFKYSSSSAGRGGNLAYFYGTIKAANGKTYSSTQNSTLEVTGSDLFEIDGIAKSGSVRLLTLPEVNTANNLSATSEAALTETTGLYKLDALTLKNSAGTSITPYKQNGMYWLASPVPGNTAKIYYISCYGSKLRDSIAYAGVRPVITLESNIQLTKMTSSNGSTYYKIVE